MKTVRVLVANRPRLMRELVSTTISDQPDIEIVGEVVEESQIEAAVTEKNPDFLIVALGESDRLPEPCNELLVKYPKLRIIAIAPDRNSSLFYRALLNVEASQIEASEQGVLDTLRGKTQLVGN